MLYFNHSEQTFNIYVTVDDANSFTVTCDVSWLSVSPSSGKGKKILICKLKENTSLNSRKGNITIKLKNSDCNIQRIVSVTQSGKDKDSSIKIEDTTEDIFTVTFLSSNAKKIQFNNEIKEFVNGKAIFNVSSGNNYTYIASNDELKYSIKAESSEIEFNVLEITPIVSCERTQYKKYSNTVNIVQNVSIPITLETETKGNMSYTLMTDSEYGYVNGNKIIFNTQNDTKQDRTLSFTATSTNDTTINASSFVKQNASPYENHLLTVYSESGGTVTIKKDGELISEKQFLERNGAYYAIFSLSNGDYKINRDKPDDIIGEKHYKGLEVTPKRIEFSNPNETASISVSGWSKIDDTIKFLKAPEVSVTINNSDVVKTINFGKNIIPGSGDKWMFESDIKATFNSSNPNFKINGSTVTAPSNNDTFQSSVITISALNYESINVIAVLKEKGMDLSETIILSLKQLIINRDDIIDSIVPINEIKFKNVGGTESLYGYYVIYDTNTKKVLSSTNLYFEGDYSDDNYDPSQEGDERPAPPRP